MNRNCYINKFFNFLYFLHLPNMSQNLFTLLHYSSSLFSPFPSSIFPCFFLQPAILSYLLSHFFRLQISLPCSPLFSFFSVTPNSFFSPFMVYFSSVSHIPVPLDASTKRPQPVFILSIYSSLNDFIPDE